MSASATAYSYDFVERSLPAGAARVLEVGCGDGALATRLQSDGLAVVALDSDEHAVASARARGVDARVAAWPDFSDGVFDAVLFTRSLHHMDDLRTSISAAMACLTPGGRLIVEDFDFDYASETGLGWFRQVVGRLAAAGVRSDESGFVAALMSSDLPPLEAWHAQHNHLLHGARAIEVALRVAAEDLTRESAAYFFRYLAGAAPDAERLMEEVRREELDRIERGLLEPLGRRFVAWR